MSWHATINPSVALPRVVGPTKIDLPAVTNCSRRLREARANVFGFGLLGIPGRVPGASDAATIGGHCYGNSAAHRGNEGAGTQGEIDARMPKGESSLEGRVQNNADEKHNERKFVFFVDGVEYQSETRSLTGAQIKSRIAGLQPGYQLVEEGRGERPDRVISDGDTVDLDVHPPLHFYIAPPATFGS